MNLAGGIKIINTLFSFSYTTQYKSSKFRLTRHIRYTKIHITEEKDDDKGRESLVLWGHKGKM